MDSGETYRILNKMNIPLHSKISKNMPRINKTSKQLEEIIINMYLDGCLIRQILNITNKSNTTFYRILKRNNINTNRKDNK